MSETSMKDYENENEKLQEVLNYLKRYIENSGEEKEILDKKLEYSIKHYNPDNTEQFNELTLNVLIQSNLEKKLIQSQKALKSPYFARVDFTPQDTMEKEVIYIGKMNFMREDNTILITDWRAPIATLYYEGRLGEAYYKCEEGDIYGEILLKRQYTIEDGVLKSIMDIDITANDEFLQAALGSSKDKRLKDIVTTIQAEQNKVIRADIYKNLIVQGAAGGGKTTIALHRIAYLLYTYSKKIKPEQVIIMAPNRFFISYISDVLPELGVDNILQTTYEDFATEYISKELKIINPTQVLSQLIENNIYTNLETKVSHLKSSLKYKDVIEKYLKVIISKIIPSKDFSVCEYVLYKANELNSLLHNDYAFMPVANRIEKIRNLLMQTLKNKKQSIIDYIDNDYDKRKERVKKQMPDSDERRKLIVNLLNERDQKIANIKKNTKTAVKDYMASFKFLSPLQYYGLLLKQSDIFNSVAKDIFTEKEISDILEVSNQYLDKKHIETDDLAAILLLQCKLLGYPEGAKIRQVVIDEAQDFSSFQFYVLKEILPNAYFSILGDLSQAIYSYRGVGAWEDIICDVFEEKPCNYLTLIQSYRTTVEIMDTANEVIKQLDNDKLPMAKPVIRHGSPVLYMQKLSTAEMAKKVDEMISDFIKKEYKSFAIIFKTMIECKMFKKSLATDAYIITGQENDYKGGVLIIPSYLVKGLEFDVVFVGSSLDISLKEKKEELDIKLLYIAMTRALHELVLLW